MSSFFKYASNGLLYIAPKSYNNCKNHVLKRTKRKNAISFEIRYRRNGYNIYVTASTLEVAKKKFVTATLPENIEKYRNKTTALKVEKNTLKAVALEWL